MIATKKKATPKVMKLVDERTGLMECRVCGNIHLANLQSRLGKFPIYYRGSWQCRYGCQLEGGA